MIAVGFFLSSLALAAGAPAFEGIEGKDVVSGAPVSVGAAVSGKPVVAVFLSSRCPCSIAHEPTLKELAAAHPEARFVGVSSNADETIQEVREHFARSGLPFPVIRDENSRLADRWGALKTPHAFVFGAGGELLFQGGVDDSRVAERVRKRYLADVLLAAKSGKTPDPREARALGCVIRR